MVCGPPPPKLHVLLRVHGDFNTPVNSNGSIEIGGVTHTCPIRSPPAAKNAIYRMHYQIGYPTVGIQRMIPLIVDKGPVHEPANTYAKKLLAVSRHGNPKDDPALCG